MAYRRVEERHQQDSGSEEKKLLGRIQAATSIQANRVFVENDHDA